MIIRPEEFDPALIASLPIIKRRGRGGKRGENFHYKDIVCAFDIETSKVPHGSHEITKGVFKQDYIAFMFVWQFQVGEGITIIGRTWPEFVNLLKGIAAACDDQQRVVVYVHNLSYEWSFIRDAEILGPYIHEESVFCIKPRRVAKFLCLNDRIEFRCSYIHSNMGLDTYTAKMRVKHQKLSGEEFDYSKVRYPWTELTERELEYCANDVIGLVEAINAEMKFDGDSLYSIPMTSTGYVRRDIKKALYKRHEYIRRLLPAADTYRMFRAAFRGGDTHANRFLAGKTLPGPINSVDRSSSYPDVQCNGRFPVSEFYNPSEKDRHSWHAMAEKMRKDRAIIMQVTFQGIRLRDPFMPVPYLSEDKCRMTVRAAYDNGRILSADWLDTTITDIDLIILLRDYVWESSYIQRWQYARYGPLPIEVISTVEDYYRRKTELKNVAGREVEYDKSKALLNALFGMSAQDPVRMTVRYEPGAGEDGSDYIEGALIDGEFHAGSREQYLEFLLDQSDPVMPYQWGVWTTALARLELRKLIWMTGERFIYCDTDSIYYYGDVDFSAYNAEKKAASIKSGAYATDPAGIVHYMGMVEPDEKNGPYREFKTLGAKKYAYRDRNGKLHITISGVVKDEGARELESAGGLKAFDPGDCTRTGFVFRNAGGVDIIYQDEPVGFVELDGHELYVGTGAVLINSTYTLSSGDNYTALLETLLDNSMLNILNILSDLCQLCLNTKISNSHI